MKERNTEAARLESDYWTRLEDTIRSWDHEEAEEIRSGVREHIEEAVSAYPGDGISLVQMAEVLERLGPPETYSRETSSQTFQTAPSEQPAETPSPASPPPPPVAEPSEPVESESAKADWHKFLDKLWLALLVGVVGLHIPVIDFYICSLISAIMLMFSLKGDVIARSPEFSSCRKLLPILIALICITPITSILNMMHPAFGIFHLPTAIGLLAVELMLFWKIMTALGELVSGYSREDIADRIYRARTTYIVLTLVFLSIAFMAAVIYGLQAGSISTKEEIMLGLVLSAISLPIGWVVGWLFYLRPVSMAKKALE